MNLLTKLMKIQAELKAPKGQFNGFGKYNYRNCEDILEALKPLLADNKTALVLDDEIVLIGERYYIKATATIYDCDDVNSEMFAIAYAREEENKKGMDSSQLTGSTSSYARKYALNGLFAIDDTKDSDTTNKHGKEVVEPKKDTPKKQPIEEVKAEVKTDTISKPQQSRLFAISNGNNDLVKEALKMNNLTSTSQIKKSDYISICKYIEEVVKANTDTDEETPS